MGECSPTCLLCCPDPPSRPSARGAGRAIHHPPGLGTGLIKADNSLTGGDVDIGFQDDNYRFRPWLPRLGPVFRRAFAFDCETTPIDPVRPWLTPAYVVGAAFDGRAGVFVPRKHLAAFWDAHRRPKAVFHNAPFDLDVIQTAAPRAALYDRVDADRVWDTQLLHRLLVLGEEGHAAQGAGQSTLERCARDYLGADLPKDVTDGDGNPVRLSYGKWLGKPARDIDPEYLHYLALDVVATYGVYRVLGGRLKDLSAGAAGEWGYVGRAWLQDRVRRFGPQTHHVQLKAAVALRHVTAAGIRLDVGRREALTASLAAKLDEQKAGLRKHGYRAGGDGSGRSLQAVLARCAARHPGLPFPRTETGRFAANHDALVDIAAEVPFVKALQEYRETEKILGSFLGKMTRPEVHPSFNVLVRTGRTSSYGEINAQNLPRDDAVRACFVPRPGHVFVDADYKTIELATLAQANLSQFGRASGMADAINAGADLHALVAGEVLGKAPADVTAEERRKAKAINFGKPVGMGDETLTQYAKVNYGVTLTCEEARGLSDSWFRLFPEMRAFLADAVDTGLGLAARLGLTPASHQAATGDGCFLRHAGRDPDEPSAVLGGMCLKALGGADPATRDGRLYPAADVDYFWSMAAAAAGELPPAVGRALRDRKPSQPLRRAVAALVGRAGVFTDSGRLRAAAGYCARHNTVFQGLAADGAKLGLWRLFRAGYRVVNFIHDQVLVEVPDGPDLRRDAEAVCRHLVDGMREVVPDIRVEVNYAAVRTWRKDAEPVSGVKGTYPPACAAEAAGSNAVRGSGGVPPGKDEGRCHPGSTAPRPAGPAAPPRSRAPRVRVSFPTAGGHDPAGE